MRLFTETFSAQMAYFYLIIGCHTRLESWDAFNIVRPWGTSEWCHLSASRGRSETLELVGMARWYWEWRLEDLENNLFILTNCLHGNCWQALDLSTRKWQCWVIKSNKSKVRRTCRSKMFDFVLWRNEWLGIVVESLIARKEHPIIFRLSSDLGTQGVVFYPG